jgi:2,3-bisphosphoglycerate-dependent phosphoglycerate mutase
MQLYFIRHGQSSNNALWDRTGGNLGRSDDPELTETGIRQAEYLAQLLARPFRGEDRQNRLGFGLTHLYASPMVRAAATGWTVARETGLKLTLCKDIHEGGGIYLDDSNGIPVGQAGKPRAYFYEQHPGAILPEEIQADGWWNRDYEERPERRQRARRVLSWLIETHGGTEDRVAFISHGDFFVHFFSEVFGVPENTPVWFLMNNVGITRIDFEEGNTRLDYANRVDFLPDDLIT